LASIDRYDLFEVEEEVGFLARMIFDPFGVHDVDSGGVIPYLGGSTSSRSKKELVFLRE
jgi:hypothetical protein